MKRIVVSGLRRELGEGEESLSASVEKQLRLRKGELQSIRVLRESLDARKKSDIFYSLQCLLCVEDSCGRRLLQDKRLQIKLYQQEQKTDLLHGSRVRKGRMVVVGFGPAGIFAAWQLAKEGYAPLVVERGQDMEQRTKDVQRYWDTGSPLEASNPLFGEGGAGSFSDGKLTSRSKDIRGQLVLDLFVQAGAPKEIATMAKPHLGTDRLREIVQNLRKQIIALGGEIRFGCCFKSLKTDREGLCSVTVERAGSREEIPCDALVLAIGQGARDTYRYLYDRGFAMSPKPFAVGVRAEHPQALINESQYGPFKNHPALGAAEYKLTAQVGDRGVYSFCMCPGGYVVGASSQRGEMVVNGMSCYRRDGENANAALVVQVTPDDFGHAPLDGMYFQQRMEQAAWALGGGEGLAPACRLEDFLLDRATTRFGAVTPSFKPGVRGVNLSQCLPGFVTDSLRGAFASFDRQIKGFTCKDAVLTGVESRTSAPLRILRGENGQALCFEGVYPVGEGAGYAGGIVSAAIDGLRAAQQIIALWREA